MSPLPSALIDASARFTSNPASTTRSSPPRGQQTLNLRSSVPLEEPLAVYEQRKSSRSSHEPEETLYEGHYTGPTSGIAFMHRVQRRFKQDLVAMIGSQPNGKGPARSSVFSFGDGYFPDQPSAELLFPSRQKARQLVDRYFDFAMPTYRFLLRSAVEEWLEAMCDEIEKGGPDWHKLSDAKASIVLLVLATSALYGEGGMNLVRDGEGTEYEQR